MTAMAAESALQVVEKLQARLAANPDPKKVSEEAAEGRGGRWARCDPLTVAGRDSRGGGGGRVPGAGLAPVGSRCLGEPVVTSPLSPSCAQAAAVPDGQGLALGELRVLAGLPELSPEPGGHGDPVPELSRAWHGRCATGSGAQGAAATLGAKLVVPE